MAQFPKPYRFLDRHTGLKLKPMFFRLFLHLLEPFFLPKLLNTWYSFYHND